jgi:hypothetical protein
MTTDTKADDRFDALLSDTTLGQSRNPVAERLVECVRWLGDVIGTVPIRPSVVESCRQQLIAVANTLGSELR